MRLILIGFFCILMNVVSAQPAELLVQGASPDIYLTHSVAPKENWYSIGRIYNISPKEIAPYNKLSMDKALAIGQQLKIPLTPGNFSQNGSKAADELFVPVYHVLQDKEWMFRVSANYNKVPVENLEKWNSINKDQVKTGMKMIVGYLKVKNESALASRGSSSMKIARAQEAVASVKTQDANTSAKTLPSAPPVVVKTEPVVVPDKPAPPKQEPKITPVEDKKPVVRTETNTGANTNGGYFRSQYDQSGKSNSGSAGIFKSTSGWQDGKYYALMNNVPVGTIVKISGTSSGKTIYAKVLGMLTDMKENTGLVVRLSDAAAAELNADNESKFFVQVTY